MSGNGALLEALQKSELVANYSQAYTDVVGLPIALRSVESWQLPLRGKQRENPFCALMASKSRTCAACMQLQQKLAAGGTSQTCTATCAYGLTETVVPVRHRNEALGLLQTGQVFLNRPRRNQFDRVASLIEAAGIERKDAEGAYFATPVVTEGKLQAAAGLLTTFAEHLVLLSEAIAVQWKNAEPPAITRAKEYVMEHLTEKLSLHQIAAFARTSDYYFCKLFRKTTGSTLTSFIGHARIDRAKNLLINPNLTVSEIAFESGFQSLTHFNRLFKATQGESPTKYRNRLPGMPHGMRSSEVKSRPA